MIYLLQGSATVELLLNEQTPAWLDLFKTPLWAQRLIATWPQNQLLTRTEMEALLAQDMPSLNDQQQARILEAAALTAYRNSQETRRQFLRLHP